MLPGQCLLSTLEKDSMEKVALVAIRFLPGSQLLYLMKNLLLPEPRTKTVDPATSEGRNFITSAVFIRVFHIN